VIGAEDRQAPPAVTGLEPEPYARASFEALYRSDFNAVIGLAYGLSGSRSAAEELAQEAFLAAHRRWDTVGAYDDPGAWVRRVVVNRSVSLVRRRLAEARALTRLSNQRRALPVEMAPESEAFWAHVRALPRRQAQAVALHYLDDRPVADIATILGCSEATVKVHLHRGRKALAERLGAHVDEEEDQP
jgi:RNA polymerase sigma-70 factor, ECF subfamily